MQAMTETPVKTSVKGDVTRAVRHGQAGGYGFIRDAVDGDKRYFFLMKNAVPAGKVEEGAVVEFDVIDMSKERQQNPLICDRAVRIRVL